MKIFWNDNGRGVLGNSPAPCELTEAQNTWSDEVRGVKGNFLGLVDDQDNTVQFYFDASIADDVEDATHLAIVRLDFPVPAQRGSYGRQITLGEVHGIIRKVFAAGEIDYREFETTFEKW